MKYPLLNNQSIEMGFEKAKKIATSTFMSDKRIEIERFTEIQCSVFYDTFSASHVLYTKGCSDFVKNLSSIFNNYEDAWLLTLVHENAHMNLNQKCVKLCLDPADSNSQLSVIGLNLTTEQQKWLPDFHKESAIEAYCDAVLLNYAYEKYFSKWRDITQKLLKFRNTSSDKFKRDSKNEIYGDEYFCSEPLRVAISREEPIEETESAQIAFFASIENTPFHVDLINAATISLNQLSKNNINSFSERINHYFNGLIGRTVAELDNLNLKNKIKTQRVLKENYQNIKKITAEKKYKK